MSYTISGTQTSDHVAKFGISTTGDCAGLTLEVGGVVASSVPAQSGTGWVGSVVGDKTGQVYQWKRNGVVVGSGTVAAYEVVDGGSPEYPNSVYYESQNYGGSIDCTPVGSPTPTPSPAPTMGPSPGNSPQPSPSTLVNPGGTATTRQDFYDAVRAGTRDAADDFPELAGPEVDLGPTPDASEGRLNELAASAGEMANDAGAMVGTQNRASSVAGVVGWMGSLNFGPPLGKSSVYTTPAVSYMGKTFGPIDYDLTKWPDIVPLIRLLLLWVITVLFFFRVLELVGSLAD
jgi:hypothetical protein